MTDSQLRWGSDAIADILARGVGLVTYMPGSTLTGLLETLSSRPQTVPAVLCLHEASAVSVAHGYTKTAGRPAAVLLHSSVGLLNAAMAIYNAALDLAPLVLLIGTAPQRAAHRRPWIDHIHAGEEFAAVTVHLAKHTSVAPTLTHALEQIRVSMRLALEAPSGPVAIFVDREALEEPIPAQDHATEPSPRGAEDSDQPESEDVSAVAQALTAASRPVLLAGRLGLSGWDERVALAEAAGLAVITDLRLPGAFPTNHPSYAGGFDLQGRAFGDAAAVLGSADTVVALEWSDPRGASDRAGWTSRPPKTLFDVGMASAITAPLAARPESFPFECRRIIVQGQKLISALAGNLPRMSASTSSLTSAPGPGRVEPAGALSLSAVAGLLRDALHGRRTTLVKVPVEWRGEWWEITDPHSYLGYDGGAGLGSGSGLLVGAALGLNMGRLAVAVLGDGDLLMGVNALWTTLPEATPWLLVIIDNEGFGNEAHHFAKIARQRGRPDAWGGLAFPFRNHPIDLTGTVRDLGVAAFGPARDIDSTRQCLAQCLAAIDSGRSAVAHVKLPREG